MQVKIKWQLTSFQNTYKSSTEEWVKTLTAVSDMLTVQFVDGEYLCQDTGIVVLLYFIWCKNTDKEQIS